VFNAETAQWEAPVPRVPGYFWDENTLSWVQPDSPFPSWEWVDDRWRPPVPYPIENPTPDDVAYEWNEATASWVEVAA